MKRSMFLLAWACVLSGLTVAWLAVGGVRKGWRGR